MNIAERVTPTAVATTLVVRCLGRFRLEDSSGNQLQVRTRKARAVVGALALNVRPMSRDRLADLLWSDRGPVQAKSSLRQAIFELQHFECGGSPILVVSRDDLAIHRDHLVTDLELVRSAAAEGEWGRLLALLEGSEPGLLTDLDGLDAEFDDWLRLQRAQEPARTLAATAGAAERCRTEAGPRAALDLVSEILRLDPVNEEATRLALRIDHELGDSRALHHHFTALSDRLSKDYDASPSPETEELLWNLSSDPASRRPPVEKAGTGGPESYSGDTHPQSATKRWPRVLVPLLVLAVAAALLVLLVGRDRAAAPAGSDPILLAVLPFDQQPAGDSFLAEGLWDDTRTALSQNRSLQVLGRTTTRAMADSGSPPQSYARRLGVDYLLEGSVRRNADQVRVTVSLIRTSDGVAIWNSVFRGRLGDPMALQEAIAKGIEGRLRGRLAQGGGRRAEQIATTPEVYTLYSEARSLLRQRGRDEATRANVLLRRTVERDPNFAPAWSSLGAALYFQRSSRPAQVRAEALEYIRHALALAPNLAEAHAALGFIEGEGSATAERALRRAVELDSGNAEAWNWLGNVYLRQGRRNEGARAYARAIELDPLWFPPVHNLATDLTAMGDRRGVDQLMRKIARSGASRELVETTRAEMRFASGDYSGGLRLLFALRDQPLDRRAGSIWWGIYTGLMRLDYGDEAARFADGPSWFGRVVRSETFPPTDLEGRPISSGDFWHSQFLRDAGSRAMVNRNRGGDLIKLYDRAFRSRDDAVSVLRETGGLHVTPSLAVALTEAGRKSEADYLLNAAAQAVQRVLRNAPGDRDQLARLARIRAAQGQRDEALRLIERAVGRGWLPDGMADALDLRQEPAFRALHGDPRFEVSRKRILDHIAKERAELGPLKV